MSAPESILARVRKIAALARSGAPGERDTAARMLDELCRRHGIAASDFEAEERRLVAFDVVDGSPDARLLMQCAAHILDVHTVKSYRHKRTRKVLLELTPLEERDLRACFGHYLPRLREHLDLALRAFVHAESIFPATEKEGGAPSSISAKDLHRLLAMVLAVQPQQWRRPAAALTVGGAS